MSPEDWQLLVVLAAVFGCLTALVYSVLRVAGSQRLAYEERAVAAVGKKLSQLYMYMDPEKFYHLCTIAAVVLFLVGMAAFGASVLKGVLLGAILASLGFVVPWVLVSVMVRRHLDKLSEQLPGGLDMLSSSLRAGVPLSQAIQRCTGRVPAPLKYEFRVMVQEQRLGNSLVESLSHWAERTGLQDVKLVAVASEISLKLGGDLAGNYETLADMIRQRQAFKKQVKSLTAEGRLQAMFMAILPFVVLVLMTLIDSERMWPFIQSGIGAFLLVLVAVMQLGAYFWIRKITHIEF